MTRTLGVVLAGGSGSRMARGPNKALITLGGRTLLARAVATLHEICDDVIVAMSPLRPLPAREYAGARAILDPPGTEGPLAALVATLEAEPFERAIVLGVDLPLVPASSLAALAAMLDGERAVLAAPQGRPQPLAAAYAHAALAPLAARVSAGERRAVRGVRALHPRLVPDAVLATWPHGLAAWLNVNSPADLIAAERFALGPRGGRAA
jgi:molybdenum cofactor guanylyltransferase